MHWKRLYSVLWFEEENNEGDELGPDKIEEISFSNVSFQYTENVLVLDDINVKLKKRRNHWVYWRKWLWEIIFSKKCCSVCIHHIKGLFGSMMKESRILPLIAFVIELLLSHRILLFFKGSILDNLKMGKSLKQCKTD